MLGVLAKALLASTGTLINNCACNWDERMWHVKLESFSLCTCVWTLLWVESHPSFAVLPTLYYSELSEVMWDVGPYLFQSSQRNGSAWFLPAWCCCRLAQHGSWDNTQCWQSLASNTVQLRGPTTPINSLASASSLGRPCFLTYAEALFRWASESIATASSGQFFLLCTAHRCPFPAPENRWRSHLFLSDDSGLFQWVSLFQVSWGIHQDSTNCSQNLLYFVPMKNRRWCVFL